MLQGLPVWPTTSSLAGIVPEFVTFYGSFEQSGLFSAFAFQPIYTQVGFLAIGSSNGREGDE
jgi:hypothetical protein